MRKNLESVKGEAGTIFNFFLFSLADRSFNDLTQYPVFPWILADYKSEELGKMSLIVGGLDLALILATCRLIKGKRVFRTSSMR